MLEIDVGGVMVPAPLVWAGLALALGTIADRLSSKARFYGKIWYRGLFNVAVFTIVWGAISFLAYQRAFFAAYPR